MDRDVTPARFFLRRLYRIVPIYWIASILMSLAMFPDEYWFKLGSFIFLPVSHPISGLIEPIVQPGWTLNYEMFFYTLFAVTLMLREQFRLFAMAAILGGIVLGGTLIKADGVVGFYSNSIVLEFLMGMAIARYPIKTHWVLVPLGLLGLATFSSVEGPRALTLGVPAVLIVAGMLSLEARVPRFKWAILIGDASYSIYLFQIISLAVFLSLWHTLALDRMLFVPAALTFIVLSGIAVHKLVEKPIMGYFVIREQRHAERQPVSQPTLRAPAPMAP